MFLCDRLPTEEEFRILSVFPDVFFKAGDCRNKRDLVKAGIIGSDRVVILNYPLRQKGSEEQIDPDSALNLADSPAIMINHLIYNMFHHTGTRKTVIMELRTYFV